MAYHVIFMSQMPEKVEKLEKFELAQCVLISYTILNSHTHLILAVDLSYTRAPPHLIEALRMMIGMVVGVCLGFKRSCLCKVM